MLIACGQQLSIFDFLSLFLDGNIEKLSYVAYFFSYTQIPSLLKGKTFKERK